MNAFYGDAGFGRAGGGTSSCVLLLQTNVPPNENAAQRTTITNLTQYPDRMAVPPALAQNLPGRV